MKIRIKNIVPECVIHEKIAEKLLGCEISLSTIANPEGIDLSKDQSWMAKALGIPVSEIKHEVDVEMMLTAIHLKHGEAVHNEIRDLMERFYGGISIISTLNIPIIYCEVISD